jgi:hypothetical protein
VVKVEAGKTYQTAAGDLVRIYATDGQGTHPVHGANRDENGWQADTWMADGTYCLPAGSSGYDLVSEVSNAVAEREPLATAQQAICAEIVVIMETYRLQEDSENGVGTPGGLEHMGDVWRLFRAWDERLRNAK